MNDIIDLAVIYNIFVSDDGSIDYEPIKVEEGIYDNKTKIFTSKNGVEYSHIMYLLDDPDSVGFGLRKDIYLYKKEYIRIPLFIVKKLILKKAKKAKYKLGMLKDRNNNIVPAILVFSKKKTEPNIFLDTESIIYYTENYPDFAKNISNTNEVNHDNKASNVNMQEEIKIDVQTLYKEITSNVIGQEEPIKKILTAIWKQYDSDSDDKPMNILINGSTGVGKTEIFRVLTKILDIPSTIVSATDYSATGYKGGDVSDMLLGLIISANGDFKRAERGILIIDEVDKLSESNSSNSQINQKDVQEGLLKILEDGKVNIEYDKKKYVFDTSKLLVVAMGSWSRIKNKPQKKNMIGFSNDINTNIEENNRTEKDIQSLKKEIIDNGMIPEFVGRFPIVVKMNELDKECLIKILKDVKNNALNRNIRFLEKKGIKLTVNDDTLEEIAKKAAIQSLGARSLDEIVETSLSEATFEIASNIAVHPNIYSELIITPETIGDNKKYTLVRRK